MRLPHIRIKRAALQEFLLLSAVNNLPFLQNDNLICVLNGRQTMCNHQQGLSFGKGHDGFLDFIFILRVSEGSCLVQNHNRRIFQDCSRNSNSLLFSAGEPLASITGRGIISFFQSNNEIITAGRFCGGIYFLIRSIWITQADVLFERAVE